MKYICAEYKGGVLVNDNGVITWHTCSDPYIQDALIGTILYNHKIIKLALANVPPDRATYAIVNESILSQVNDFIKAYYLQRRLSGGVTKETVYKFKLIQQNIYREIDMWCDLIVSDDLNLWLSIRKTNGEVLSLRYNKEFITDGVWYALNDIFPVDLIYRGMQKGFPAMLRSVLTPRFLRDTSYILDVSGRCCLADDLGMYANEVI